MIFTKNVEKIEGTFKVPHQRAQQAARDQNKVITDCKNSFQKDSDHGALTQHHQDSILRLDHRLLGEKDIDKTLNCEIDNNQYIENSESMPLFLPNSDAVISKRNICSISSDHTRIEGKYKLYLLFIALFVYGIDELNLMFIFTI